MPDPRARDRLGEIWAVRDFFAYSIVPDGYSPPERCGDAIGLTAPGQALAELLEKRFPEATLAARRVAVMLQLFHRSLLVDVARTDVATLMDVLHSEIVGGNLRFPWIFGRQLYDRFLDQLPASLESLDLAQTRLLLNGTEMGVFQIRDITVGPFGVLRSSALRHVPPVRSAPLSHCSDPSCAILHTVHLGTGSTTVAVMSDDLAHYLIQTEGTPSDWEGFFDRINGSPDYYDHLHTATLPFLLGNGLSKDERRVLIRDALRTFSDTLRGASHHARLVNRIARSPEETAERLSEAENFQLLLLLRDEQLVQLLERSIRSGAVGIPDTETRHFRFAPNNMGRGWHRVAAQCSKLGVRFVSADLVAVPHLRALLLSIYSSPEGRELLNWKLRHVAGTSPGERIDTYLQTADPRRVIEDMVFSTPDRLQSAFKFLRYGDFRVPDSPAEERQLVESILWKLGFEVHVFPAHQRLFWERLETLRRKAAEEDSAQEPGREAIRSVGANFFVSTEELLEYALAFSSWALFSDHILDTRFVYHPDSALKTTAELLNAAKIVRDAGGQPVRYDERGRNTLFALVEGFAALARIAEEALANSEVYRRTPSESPRYAGRSEVFPFVFRHKKALLDVETADIVALVDHFRNVTASLRSIDLAGIRNRIDHKRHDFPSRDEISRLCDSMSSLVTEMERLGVLPTVLFISESRTDTFGRMLTVLRDYRGRELTLHAPSHFEVRPWPRRGGSVVVLTAARVRDSAHPLRFLYQVDSDYVRMWSNYPRRRQAAGPAVEMESGVPVGADTVSIPGEATSVSAE